MCRSLNYPQRIPSKGERDMKKMIGILGLIVLSACGAKQGLPDMQLSMIDQGIKPVVWSGSSVTFQVHVNGGKKTGDMEVAWFTGERTLCDWEQPSEQGISKCEFEVGEDIGSIVIEARNSEGGGSVMGLQLSILTLEDSQAMGEDVIK